MSIWKSSVWVITFSSCLTDSSSHHEAHLMRLQWDLETLCKLESSSGRLVFEGLLQLFVLCKHQASKNVMIWFKTVFIDWTVAEYTDWPSPPITCLHWDSLIIIFKWANQTEETKISLCYYYTLLSYTKCKYTFGPLFMYL